ncbi:MAG: universal stress protein [Anaerolineales bacterium]|jgi:nucleotide-binding universal stress UspA family protein
MDKSGRYHVLCAVRGRPESRETVSRAIDLALEHKARLTFVHVVNADFLSPATPTRSPLRIVYQQLQHIAEFAMLILVDRANRRGVEQVKYILRTGNIGKQLNQAINEIHPDALVIGKPPQGSKESVFKPEEFDALINEIKNLSNLDIFIVDTEDFELQKENT